jgi:hypothetical protein
VNSQLGSLRSHTGRGTFNHLHLFVEIRRKIRPKIILPKNSSAVNHKIGKRGAEARPRTCNFATARIFGKKIFGRNFRRTSYNFLIFAKIASTATIPKLGEDSLPALQLSTVGVSERRIGSKEDYLTVSDVLLGIKVH